MKDFPQPLADLIDELKRLPGIGQKSAQRIAFHLERGPREDVERLAVALIEAKDKVRLCSVCNNLADSDPCAWCIDPGRDPTVVCVVETPYNAISIEKTREFHGLYHVLHGSLSPLQGIGPEQLKLKSLIERLKDGKIRELIVATNPNVEGEATAVYLSKLIKPLGVKVTRIAMGIPVGSELEFADEVTMVKSIEGRREI
ncbi:MAG TPA: recombination mediator RecR [Terriglobia bacterium]|jgi:recombination protein RecR|nr:recombination mediator RecR [Terriglobia bacterium]